MITFDLYNPSDIEIAYETWGANCGPCALAAIARLPAMEVRRAFEGFENRRYVNPTHMKAAMGILNIKWQSVGAKLPNYGLAFIQIVGPWCNPGVPVGAAYRRTHWIGVSGEWVFDVNNGEWCPKEWWETKIIPWVIEHHKHATGWEVRSAFAVSEGTGQ